MSHQHLTGARDTELLAAYPTSDAALLDELFGQRAFVITDDFPRFVKIMANFYALEPKRGWQDQARKIIDHARGVSP